MWPEELLQNIEKVCQYHHPMKEKECQNKINENFRYFISKKHIIKYSM